MLHEVWLSLHEYAREGWSGVNGNRIQPYSIGCSLELGQVFAMIVILSDTLGNWPALEAKLLCDLGA